MRALILSAALLALAAACGSAAERQPLAGVYLALGDSLSAGNGASDRDETAFVPLVHAALGPQVELMNLGIPGDTSDDLLNGGPLDQAITEIEQRKADGIAGNEVAVVTLEIGGNDLLNLFFELVIPAICPNVSDSLNTPRCVNEFERTLETYEPNLVAILDRLRKADPDLPIFLMTLYNPFSGKSAALDDLTELTLEGSPNTPFPEGLQDIIRRQADEHGVFLVDVYPHFEGKAVEYVANDLIHPNDTGYRVIADAVLDEMRGAGLVE
jgi:lysophospholipase L1-like esterase